MSDLLGHAHYVLDHNALLSSQGTAWLGPEEATEKTRLWNFTALQLLFQLLLSL